ncbi:hypothetical protein SAMN04488483_3398 [Pseudomonas helmanticensis]|uniref:Uncharacterized protein n=1 Tax=Pseudomonas helmanticensis TaxID=1471381 RepID=A0ACD2U7W4_9PSED|nr:hypothetical protein [Pseudomonas helmanticensis]SMQ27055.1 hypothetical protein SAMN04488483_3398 [Pseudomonas helmanticensis]
MTWRIALSKRRCWAWLVPCAVLALAVAHRLTQPLWDDPVIALELGGTYENMSEHSTAPFSPLIRGHVWGGIPKTDARLRLVDSQYGFETPLARFLSVGFNDNVVDDIRMSPQIEPLLIDDAMKVVLDLQAQWCAKGWRPVGTRRYPTIADTPEWRAYLRPGVLQGHAYWQAGDKYQVMLILARFRDSRHLDQERYLITLDIGEAWRLFEEDERRFEPHHSPPPQPKKGATPCPSLPS